MQNLPGALINADNPQVKEAVAKMVREGYEKETIMRVVGVPAEIVDSAKLRFEGKTAPERKVKVGKRIITEGQHKEMIERMAKMRAARGKKKIGSVAKSLKSE